MKQIAGLPVSDDVAACNPELQDDINQAQEKPSKYRNAKTEAVGMVFQSGREASLISQLVMLEGKRQGVFGLRLQVSFPLGEDSTYFADATYIDENLVAHIVDAKGFRTKEFIRKRRLFKKYYGREIEEL